MSFLTPFYVLGALAIAAPIILHLIRRTPKGEVPFSSLMFLAPTPPRLTRRSRQYHSSTGSVEYALDQRRIGEREEILVGLIIGGDLHPGAQQRSAVAIRQR